ncbi:GIY-YIG nuclease family protein [Desulfoluna sp.]|uniref:GIY-YIG nuclease family protein n=1 Tax=Desulfoluna sp. TaxID=2045199 RepID=UPI00345AB074
MLQSEFESGRFYTGITSDIRNRLKSHNEGKVSHTSKYRPWKIEIAIAFPTKSKAFAFEHYLKSHSGRAFAAKHF